MKDACPVGIFHNIATKLKKTHVTSCRIPFFYSRRISSMIHRGGYWEGWGQKIFWARTDRSTLKHLLIHFSSKCTKNVRNNKSDIDPIIIYLWILLTGNILPGQRMGLTMSNKMNGNMTVLQLFYFISAFVCFCLMKNNIFLSNLMIFID